MSDPDELRSIAKQLRELATERDCRWILEMGGRLVTDAVDRGAFSGIEYLQLRHLLDTSRYKGPRSPHPRVFTAVVTWLIKHIDDLPLRSRQTFFEGPRMRGGAFVAEYVPTNIPAVAELIEGEALRLDGDVTPEEPVDESRRGRQPAEAPGETWITGCDGRAKQRQRCEGMQTATGQRLNRGERMSESEFCRAALRSLKDQAESRAAQYPPLHHMLVLPPGESIRVPRLPGGHPVGSRRRPPKVVSFGDSKVASVLPPRKSRPVGLKPLRAVVAEQAFHPYRPLAREPYRIHLFFGDDAGWRPLHSLAVDLLDLDSELQQSVFGSESHWNDSVFYRSSDSLHGEDARMLDSWACTIHWWAWKCTDSPVRTKPKVVFGGGLFDADYMDPAVGKKLSLSYLACDVFTATAATIDLFLRFLDTPPELFLGADYPPTADRSTSDLAKGVEVAKPTIEPTQDAEALGSRPQAGVNTTQAPDTTVGPDEDAAENDEAGPALTDEEVRRLAEIPLLDKESGAWVTAVAAARDERQRGATPPHRGGNPGDVTYLKTARGRRGSLRSKDRSHGIDSRSRKWRRDPDDTQALWYLKVTLRQKESHGEGE